MKELEGTCVTFEEKDIEPKAGSSFLKMKNMPKKFKDPRSFSIPLSINDLFVNNALLD